MFKEMTRLVVVISSLSFYATGFAAMPAFLSDQPLPTLAPMVKQVSPAVVNIAVSGSVEMQSFNPFAEDPFFRRFFDVPEMPDHQDFQSAGSGVIVNAAKGYVLTNYHVIDNADKITVTLLDERTLSAKVIGSDRDTDIALLQIAPDKLTDIRLGDSAALEVGDFVIAIGNPFGFGHTVTSGIVSALGRSGINQGNIEDFIQTDAPINPGNSGGALINLRGELVGINSAIISNSGGNLGIGFAIPINMAKSVMDQLLGFGEVSRGLLGIKILSVSPEIVEAYGLSSDEGALVAEVTPDAAAEKAGLKVGDVITSVNGKKIDSASQLRNSIGLMRPEEKVRITFVRDGKTNSVEARLGQLAGNNKSNTDSGAKDPVTHPGLQGAEFLDLPKNDERYRNQQGVLVASVVPNSPAARRGLQSGDVIIKVNRDHVHNLNEFRRAVDREGPLGLTLLRGQAQLLLPIL